MQHLKSRITLGIFLFLFIAPSILYSQQAPGIEWQKCLGGSQSDDARSLILTSDGGYAYIGITWSNGNDVKGWYGLHDVWVVKLDSLRNIEWQMCLGGKYPDYPGSIIQTSDGGLAVAMSTASNDGNLISTHGGIDAWVVKLTIKGVVEWTKCIGGSKIDNANQIIQTYDGGYVIAGSTYSNDGDVSGNHSSQEDMWAVKLTSSGSIEWQKCYGGDKRDAAETIAITQDGGYILAGYAESENGDVSGKHDSTDAWVVKIDSNGALVWQKCFGGSGNEGVQSIIATTDGGYVVAGGTGSQDGDVMGHHGKSDGWVVKLDSVGRVEWQKSLGGFSDDYLYSIISNSAGGYTVSGYTESSDELMPRYHGGSDAWIVCLSSSGDVIWQNCLGGDFFEAAYSIVQMPDGGWVFGGVASSYDGDVSGNHHYSPDSWVVKLQAPSSVDENSVSTKEFNLTTYPNPSAKTTTLSYDLPKASSEVVITISSVTGERMQEIRKQGMEAGHHEVSLDLGRFAAGTYYVTVAAGGLSETTEIKVVK